MILDVAAQLEALWEAPIGLALFDRDLRYVRVNAALAAINGVPAADHVGRTVLEVLPDQNPEVVEQLRRVLETGTALDVEVAGHTPRDPALHHWRVSYFPVREGAVVRGVGATVVDITEQRRAERAAQAERDFMAAVLDTTANLIVVLDREANIVRFNRACERATGYAAAEVVGRSLFDTLVPPAELGGVRDAFQALRRGDFPNTHRNRWRRKDGALRLLEWANTCIADEQGAVRFVIGTGTDVTDREAAEEALRALNERLREADRRKNHFLGVLSHELRNPLAPIRNSLYILGRAEATPEQARRAQEVANRQIGHVTRLVDDLLDVTRIENGKIQLQRDELDLAALARRAAEDHRPLMLERRIALALEVSAEPVRVLGDETRLAQVLGNLLQNAAKFTPPGGRVALAASAVAGVAVLRVRDTGAGIEPAQLSTIFEPFMQAPQTLAQSEGGLGLGLALVKGLVAMHGGEVSAWSAGPGRGAEFTVTLPLARPMAERAPFPPAGAAGSRTARRHVLVVDDNEDAADSLAQLLAIEGHEVEVAHDGPSALALVRTRRPDVVLCDIGLPGMDGYELARRLRRSEAGGARLVAVSGYAQAEDVTRATEAGFDAHLAKPPDPDQLAAVLG